MPQARMGVFALASKLLTMAARTVLSISQKRFLEQTYCTVLCNAQEERGPYGELFMLLPLITCLFSLNVSQLDLAACWLYLRISFNCRELKMVNSCSSAIPG